MVFPHHRRAQCGRTAVRLLRSRRAGHGLHGDLRAPRCTRTRRPTLDCWPPTGECRTSGALVRKADDADTPLPTFSTDMANVSLAIPTIHPLVRIETNGAVNHQPEFAAACITPSADATVRDGAVAMAWTAIGAATMKPSPCANGCSAHDHRARHPQRHPRPRGGLPPPWKWPRRSSPAVQLWRGYGSNAASGNPSTFLLLVEWGILERKPTPQGFTQLRKA